MKRLNVASLYLRLLILAALVLIPPVVAVCYLALPFAESGLAMEAEGKAAGAAQILVEQFDKALSGGMPMDRLVGVDEFLAPVLKANQEFLYVALCGADGHRLYGVGAETSALDDLYAQSRAQPADAQTRVGSDWDYSFPVSAAGTPKGSLHVGVSGRFIQEKISAVLQDVAVLIVVFFLIASEILLHVVSTAITQPLGQISGLLIRLAKGDFTGLAASATHDDVGRFARRLNQTVRYVDDLYRRLVAYVDEIRRDHFDANAVAQADSVLARVKFLYRFSPQGGPRAICERHAMDVRLALFLFAFAEELLRSFLPLYIQSLPNAQPWLSPEMVMAVPISLFMVMGAWFSPWSGRLARTLGCRNVFHMGLFPAFLGFALSGLASDSTQMVVGRLASGLGYAMATMACQVYISETARDETRTQSLGVFVGAVLTASVCGSGLGGILVEHVGFRGVFLVSALLVVAAGLLSKRLPGTALATAPSRSISRAERLALLKNWRFSVLMAFAAIPAKIAVSGVTFFLVPLYLWSMGYGYADIARMLMVYAVLVVILCPLVARLSDRTGWRLGLVATGGLIGSLGLLAPALGEGAFPVLVALVCLGVATGFSASPLLAAIPDLCWTECRAMGRSVVLGEVRRMERIGSILGPLAAAALVGLVGFGWAIVGMGVALSVMAVIFLLLSFLFGSGIHIATEEAPE